MCLVLLPAVWHYYGEMRLQLAMKIFPRFLFALSLFLSSSSEAGWLCRLFLRNTNDSAVILRGLWGESFFTDPMTHDPRNYHYSVHGLIPRIPSGTDKITETTLSIKALRDRFDDFSKRNLISTSVITQEQSKTYGDYGFVLAPPTKSQVLLTSDSDAVTPYSGDFSIYEDTRKLKEEIVNKYKGQKILGPENVIRKMKNPKELTYNEVLLAGVAFGESPPAIIGVFYASGRHGLKVEPSLLEELRKFSTEKGLPLISIQHWY